MSLPQPLDMVIGQNEKKPKTVKIGMAIVKNDREYSQTFSTLLVEWGKIFNLARIFKNELTAC